MKKQKINFVNVFVIYAKIKFKETAFVIHVVIDVKFVFNK